MSLDGLGLPKVLCSRYWGNSPYKTILKNWEHTLQNHFLETFACGTHKLEPWGFYSNRMQSNHAPSPASAARDSRQLELESGWHFSTNSSHTVTILTASWYGSGLLSVPGSHYSVSLSTLLLLFNGLALLIVSIEDKWISLSNDSSSSLTTSSDSIRFLNNAAVSFPSLTSSCTRPL